jgi:putative tryptophan/tyrosine transport system substrate-binding protein
VRFDAFVDGLRTLGWTDGRNVTFDVRWGAPSTERFRRHAAELIALQPDVILAASGATMPALTQATRTVPIVFLLAPDPVGSGFVESLSRPGGNVTGFTPFEFGMSGKWLELLKELTPGIKRAAVLRDPIDPAGIGQFGAIRTASQAMGIEALPVDVRAPRRSNAACGRSQTAGTADLSSPEARRRRRIVH